MKLSLGPLILESWKKWVFKMNFQLQILNSLLDKYEASRHYQGQALINRKVKFLFTHKNMPLYWDTDKPHLKLAIHQSVQNLKKKGLSQLIGYPLKRATF